MVQPVAGRLRAVGSTSAPQCLHLTAASLMVSAQRWQGAKLSLSQKKRLRRYNGHKKARQKAGFSLKEA